MNGAQLQHVMDWQMCVMKPNLHKPIVNASISSFHPVAHSLSDVCLIQLGFVKN